MKIDKKQNETIISFTKKDLPINRESIYNKEFEKQLDEILTKNIIIDFKNFTDLDINIIPALIIINKVVLSIMNLHIMRFLCKKMRNQYGHIDYANAKHIR